MIQPARNIIKANDVKMAGTVMLSQAGQPRPAANPVQQNTNQQTQVTVVESNGQYAVLRVVCGCGETIDIKCDYAEQQQ